MREVAFVQQMTEGENVQAEVSPQTRHTPRQPPRQRGPKTYLQALRKQKSTRAGAFLF